ncbi:MAG: LCP family protein [Spirochaetales bacterium]|nr:LCP family protein [Spirochaetales bacterium]
MRRKKAVDRIIILLMLVIISASAGLLFTKLKTDRITNAVEADEAINTMIIVHNNGELIFSELFMYDSKTGKGSLFDIPGYIGSIINELKKMDRIDVLFDKANPSVYVEKAANILNTEIPYYISIELNDFSKIVDLFEGVNIFIANPVELLDMDNIILLPSGNLVLDGYKTISYLAFQDETLSDVEHISRRQKILQSLFNQFNNKNSFLKSRNFTNYLNSYIISNLKKDAVISFFDIFTKLDIERIVFQRVLGNTRLVGEKNLLFPHYEGKLLRETVQQTITSLANTEVISADELNVIIEILNATEQSGLAGRTSQVFKSFGYDVARVANYEKESMDKTVVVSWNGDRTTAEKVADIILCKDISYDPGSYFGNNLNTYNSEIIIILGKDFDGRYCKE